MRQPDYKKGQTVQCSNCVLAGTRRQRICRKPATGGSLSRYLLAGVLMCGLDAVAMPIDYGAIEWSIHVLIDNSETVLGVDQSDRPRDVRGLEITSSGDFLYAGFNNPSSGFEVRRLDLSLTGNDSFVNRVAGFRGKAIAVDDMGRVYLAEGTSVEIRSADLSTSLGTLSGLTKVEGVAVTRDAGGTLIMYLSDRTNGDLTKYNLTEGAGGSITAFMVDTSFGTGGSVALGSDPRGVAVDADGRIWVAGKGVDAVYRVSPDGQTVTSVSYNDPFDVTTFDTTVLISLEDDLQVAVLDALTMSAPVPNLEIPWTTLGLDGGGTLGGIAVNPLAGIFLANEGGQTSPPFPDGSDDNDPILFGSFFPEPPTTVPEPATIALMAIGVLGMGASVRKRRS